MSRLVNGLRRSAPVGTAGKTAAVTGLVSASSPGIALGTVPGELRAMKLSTVNRCQEVLSDSMAKLPAYVMDRKTREHIDLPILQLLNVRPNEAMAPSVRKKTLEGWRLTDGNAYDWIVRDPRTLRPVELIPVAPHLVQPWRDSAGHVWYFVQNPVNGEFMRLPSTDMMHYKAYSSDGLRGIGVLQRAAMVINSGLAAQEYQANFYMNGGQPSGVLQTDTDIGGMVTLTVNGEQVTATKKEFMRQEWEKIHNGPTNAHRIAILDNGLKYTPIAMSQADAQFVESQSVSVQDIARFYGVPEYKLMSGKQAYSSNTQNATEYVVGTLHPIVKQYEEEQSYKLLTPSQLRGYTIGINMMAELRGDFASRGVWYKTMREIGVYSPNDICAYEELPDVPGGDTRYANKNFAPLDIWRELVFREKGG